MEEHIGRIREELDREREERNYFQLERDKIHTFWEITRRQLEEKKAELRNKDREMEEAEERHQVEIKVRGPARSHGSRCAAEELARGPGAWPCLALGGHRPLCPLTLGTRRYFLITKQVCPGEHVSLCVQVENCVRCAGGHVCAGEPVCASEPVCAGEHMCVQVSSGPPHPQVYKQKVKHLLYEHQSSLTEMKAEGTVVMKLAQKEHRAQEGTLRRDMRALKVELKEQELANEVMVKNLRLVGARAAVSAMGLSHTWEFMVLYKKPVGGQLIEMFGNNNCISQTNPFGARCRVLSQTRATG